MQQVTKEFSGISELIDLMSVNDLILILKHLSKLGLIDFRYLTQPLGSETIYPGVCPFLHATLKQHGAQLQLLTFSDAQFQELVGAFFEVDGTHDYQINGSTEVSKVLFGHVLNFCFCLHHFALSYLTFDLCFFSFAIAIAFSFGF